MVLILILILNMNLIIKEDLFLIKFKVCFKIRNVFKHFKKNRLILCKLRLLLESFINLIEVKENQNFNQNQACFFRVEPKNS